ncbi:MAG: hypothetical protein ABL994_15815 [Verrucomicrobiales bacterium]
MKRIALQLILCATALSAQEEEEFLPSRFSLERYTAGWENSPSNREVVKVVAAQVVSAFGRDIVLEGVISDDQTGTIAYARDLVHGNLMIITEKISEEHPFNIKSNSQANDPRETSVTITDGKEEAEIRYEVKSLTQTITTDPVPAGGAADTSQVPPPPSTMASSTPPDPGTTPAASEPQPSSLAPSPPEAREQPGKKNLPRRIISVPGR